MTCSENCSQIFTFRFTDQQNSSIALSGENLSVEIGIKDTAINNGSDIVGKIYNLIVSKQSDFISNLLQTDETVRFSKNKILEQFGQAMLAHTNQDSDSVLHLLESF